MNSAAQPLSPRELAQGFASKTRLLEAPAMATSTISSDSGLSTSSSDCITAATSSHSDPADLIENPPPSKSSSYFITAMPSISLPYCSPAAPIEEAYPFESSRLLPRISADKPPELSRKSVLAECKHCGNDGMTRIRYKPVTTANILLSILAPLAAPFLLSSRTCNRFSAVRHECAVCGKSFADSKENCENSNDVTGKPSRQCSASKSRKSHKQRRFERTRDAKAVDVRHNDLEALVFEERVDLTHEPPYLSDHEGRSVATLE